MKSLLNKTIMWIQMVAIVEEFESQQDDLSLWGILD